MANKPREKNILSIKINIPLKLKIVSLLSTLLLGVVGFYLYYALNIFKEDKAADIYALTLSHSQSLQEQLENIIQTQTSLIDSLNRLSEAGTNLETVISNIVEENPTYLHLACLGPGDSLVESSKKDFEQFQLKENEITYLQNISSDFSSVERKNSSSPYLVFIKKINSLSCKIVSSLDILNSIDSTNEQLESYFINKQGNLFYNVSKKDMKQISHLSKSTLDKFSKRTGVTKLKINAIETIIAYAPLKNSTIIAITEVAESNAFSAARLLIKKSLYYGIAILSFSIIIGILFAQKITQSLQNLTTSAEIIASGNFYQETAIVSNDEVGTLAKTFENMRLKIIQFMEEMKEKARLENEVKVAQLVQSSFFPEKLISQKNLSIFGAYEPASECGGDWWGYFEQKNKTTVIICDATGHGVPAALMTAAAHSTLNNIILDSKDKYISPSQVLSRLNKVVTMMQTTVQLTALVIEIDNETGELKYSNASHQPAYILRKDQTDTYSKENVIPLLGENYSRIGEKPNSEYADQTFQLLKSDIIVLYTDGILEFTNGEKSYNQRNFIKSLINSSQFKDVSKFTNGVIADFNQFRQKHPLQDDITFIGIYYSHNSENHTNSFLPGDISIIQNLQDVNNLSPNEDIIVSHLNNKQNIEHIILNKKTNHLIGANSLKLELELNLIDLYKEDPFAPTAVIFYQKEIVTNLEIPTITNEVIERIKKSDSSGINLPHVHLIIEELLSNAFYHLPSNLNHLRGVEIQSPDPIIITLEITQDYLNILIDSPSKESVKEQIVKSIFRGQSEKSPLQQNGGAGLGLYLIYEKAHQMWIIETNDRLGIRIVLERFSRNLHSEERITSFHYIKGNHNV